MKANGFCKPPVRNRSTASSATSKAGGAVRLEALRHVETQPQRHIEPGRQDDCRKAGVNRQVEIESIINHQHGGGLTDDREPAQPHQCVEAHIAARVVRAEAEYRHSAV
jgi:hypothetical protein